MEGEVEVTARDLLLEEMSSALLSITKQSIERRGLRWTLEEVLVIDGATHAFALVPRGMLREHTHGPNARRICEELLGDPPFDWARPVWVYNINALFEKGARGGSVIIWHGMITGEGGEA
jgi:hypothetical protein